MISYKKQKPAYIELVPNASIYLINTLVLMPLELIFYNLAIIPSCTQPLLEADLDIYSRFSHKDSQDEGIPGEFSSCSMQLFICSLSSPSLISRYGLLNTSVQVASAFNLDCA